MIKITFPDGSVKEFPKGITGLEIAESISSRLAQDALSITVNGQVWDLTRPIETDAAVKINTWEDEEGKHAFWHTSAHLMAEALQELYPGIKFGIGPAIENGFYYDVDPGEAVIRESDLPAIEAKMVELATRRKTEKNRHQQSRCTEKISNQRRRIQSRINQRFAGRHHNSLQSGKFYRFVSGASFAQYGKNQSHQTVECGRRLLARRRKAQATHSNLWDYISQEKNAG